MWKPGARICGYLMVQYCIERYRQLFVRFILAIYGARNVSLVHLDAYATKFMRGMGDSLIQELAPCLACLRWR